MSLLERVVGKEEVIRFSPVCRQLFPYQIR